MSSSKSVKSKKGESSSHSKHGTSGKEAVNGTDGESSANEVEIKSDTEEENSSDNERRPKKRTGESSFNKAAFSMPDDIKKLMERITCCSCGKQLNPMNPGAVRKHPWLKVTTCKKCYKFLRSGPFTRDDDGLDEQCRWCGEGGRLYGCDYCNHCFCRTCIKRNLGRSEAAIMESEENSKWHCYMCKPKKIRKLAEDCDKILKYLEAQEKKEREREERAKQREKEKAEKSKGKSKREEKTEDEDNEKKGDQEEKKTPKRGFPAPRGKSEIAEKMACEKKDLDKNKTTLPVSQSAPDLIVLDDSPAVALQKHHRTVEYKPDIKTGVKIVQKTADGVTEVHVGPKNDKPVVVPFVKQKIKTPTPNVTQSVLASGNTGRPLLMGMLTQKTNMGGIAKILPPMNDIKALKNNVLPYNIDSIIEKLGTMAQSLSLSLNSAKTDLAIARLSQPDMKHARQMACRTVTSSIEFFMGALRDVFNVQVVTNYPSPVLADTGAKGDNKAISGNLTSTPDSKKGSSAVAADLDESVIPIEIEDSSPVKKSQLKANDVETDDGDSVVFLTDNETNDVKVIPVNGVKEKVIAKTEEKKDSPVEEDEVDKVMPSENNIEREENKKLASEEKLNENCSGKNVELNQDYKTEEKMDVDEPNDLPEEIKDDSDSAEITENNEQTSDEIVGQKSRSLRSVKSVSKNEDDRENTEDMENDVKDDDESDEGRKNKSSKRNSRMNKESEEKKEDSEQEEELNDIETEEKETVTRSSRSSAKNVKDVNSNKNKNQSENSPHKIDDTRDKSPQNDKKEDANDDIDRSENTAAELELLKEMEDELNTESDNEPRRSSRTRKQVVPDVKDMSDRDSPVRRSSRQQKSSDSKNDSKLDKSHKTSDESVSEKKKDQKSLDKIRDKQKIKKIVIESDEDKTESDANEGSNTSDSKGKKANIQNKRSSRSKLEIISDDDEEETVSKSEKQTSKKNNKDSAKDNKRSSKSEKVEDEIPMEESDTTETSDSDKSVLEFGKRKKQKPASKTESKRVTRQRDKKSEESDSDPDFDKDLEKEIKSLSKETRLSKKKAKEAVEKKQKPNDKKEKAKEDKTKSKGKKDTEDDDDDNDDNDKVDDEDSDSSDDDQEKVMSGPDDDSTEEETDSISASQLKKLKQAGKAALEDDSDEDFEAPDNVSDDSSDPEVSFPNLSTPKKGKKHKNEELSDDSDFVTPKKRKRVKDKLLDEKLSDSDSDDGKKGKKGKGKKGKGKRKKEDSDQFSELSDEEENRKKGKGKKRRRIRKIESSDEEREKEPGEDDEIEGEDDTTGGFLKRKQIRKVKSSTKLTDSTKAAQKAEEERRKRIEERQKEYNTYVEVEGEDEEEVPEGTERELTTPTKAPDSIAKILGSPRKIPITTKCVLEMEKETKKPLIEVDRTLIRKLKPHQVEAVRFMYNCCIESLERLKKGNGSGCILAHCMGLGKTLSVITYIHTMLSNVKLTKMTKCLVVCPLNTVLNWVNEFEIWLDDVDFEIEIYEMSKVKQNFERAEMLKEWHEGGAGVMIMGYDMYRNLVMGSHCKNKKQKKMFYDALADPGPDMVICDEGHILKNDSTSLSKSMSKIKTPIRVVLTGTPLQNNLGEYHCMVSFVKPSLLGTRKEFNNRFANPITNGQCSDSTPFDVKLMKRRAHILHELLAGCVQRKDYSALTKFLPPKFEYVISVRLAKVQMTLYEKYLDTVLGGGGIDGMKYKGARLFTDYQALMRIWTHPWVLKLDEIRQENKRLLDDEDEDSFIDDSNDEDDSFIDDSTSESESESDSGGGKKKGKGKRKTRSQKKDSSSSDDEKKDGENGDEVVKKWTSKRRGNEEGAGSSWMDDLGYAKDDGPKEVTTEWWAEFVKEDDEFKLELSGKLTLMFEILKMCEDIGDKVLVFSQSLLSLDIIEDFLAKVDEANAPETTDGADKPTTSGEKPKENGEAKPDDEKVVVEKTETEKNKERLAQYGKSWTKGADYFRMDGSTNSQNRKAAQDMFNDPENYRARLFLISTKAGSLGINLVAANRVIIFDASWNPSHDIQSIFRVYRFGQVKPVYVYRFLAQGTMEEKIYERQVTKQSLSQRVVDEHQIERHFTSADLQELYKFQPDRLDDPEKKNRPLPMLPKDHMLAELMTHNKEWIVTYHEHDSLLENVVEQELSEEEKKAAWEDYEDEKKGISRAMGGMTMNPGLYATQQMNMQNLLLQGQANLGQAAVLQIVQDLKSRFPNLPPEVFQQRVQAVLRQVLTQQIMQQSEMQRRHVEQQRLAELQRLNQIKQQIQRQQAMINSQQMAFGMGGAPMVSSSMNFGGLSGGTGIQSSMQSLLRPQTMTQLNASRSTFPLSLAAIRQELQKK